MSAKTVASDLVAAAEYINTNGWCRNEFYNSKGQVCLAGAVGVVTGALVPTPAAKRRVLLQKVYKLDEQALADALDGKGHLADAYAWDWSLSKSRRTRYGAALRTLASQLNAERTEQLVADYDAHTESQLRAEWFLSQPEKQRQEYIANREAGRAFVTQDIVTVFNDRQDFVAPKAGGKATVRRTTKGQAVKLLQRAAASA